MASNSIQYTKKRSFQSKRTPEEDNLPSTGIAFNPHTASPEP
jgi:hypothetical protein